MVAEVVSGRLDAAFIVRACNNHEALLAALEWASKHLYAVGPYLSYGATKWHCDSCKAVPANLQDLRHEANCPWNNMRLAIAKAKGATP